LDTITSFKLYRGLSIIKGEIGAVLNYGIIDGDWTKFMGYICEIKSVFPYVFQALAKFSNIDKWNILVNTWAVNDFHDFVNTHRDWHVDFEFEKGLEQRTEQFIFNTWVHNNAAGGVNQEYLTFEHFLRNYSDILDDIFYVDYDKLYDNSISRASNYTQLPSETKDILHLIKILDDNWSTSFARKRLVIGISKL